MNNVNIDELSKIFYDKLSEANKNYESLKNYQSEGGALLGIMVMIVFISALVIAFSGINFLFIIIPLVIIIYFFFNSFARYDKKIEPLQKIHTNNVEQLKKDLIGLYSITIDNLPLTTPSNSLLIGKLTNKVHALLDALEDDYEEEEDREDIFTIINKYSASYKTIINLESKV
jgi:hypothetical protein